MNPEGPSLLNPHLDYPSRRFLFAAQYAFRSNDASSWIYGAVKDIYADDVRAFWIGVFVPHSNDHMRPRMTVAQRLAEFCAEVQEDSLVVECLRKEMH
jgi:hypothetical protein